MEQELKAYLDEQFGRVNARLDGIDRRFEKVDQRFDALEQRFGLLEHGFGLLEQQMKASEARLLQLITDTSHSLQREMASILNILTERTRRLERHGALLQTGARFSVRMVKWSEEVDTALDDLKSRVQNLEHPPSNPSTQ